MTYSILIDADELLFRACAAAEHDMPIGDNHVLMSDFGTAMRIFCDQEAKICDAVDASSVTMALSSKTNFRKEVLPTYKSNRKDSRKPLAYSRLVDWVREEYTVIEMDGLEADDVLGIHSPDFDYIAASDKDLLTIPTKVYSQLKDTITDVSPAMANYNWLLQTLVGDRVDGYAGCPGAGPVKAKAILERVTAIPGEVCGSELHGAWEAVVEAFEAKDLTAEDALQQARVARILRPLDWDFDACKPILWTP